MHTKDKLPICFNSRTREGATLSQKILLMILTVSIHAPVRVRQANADKLYSHMGFNSRTREGATYTRLDFEIDVRFNSRTREGATVLLR